MIRTGLPLMRLVGTSEEAYRAYGGGKNPPPPPRSRQQHAARLLRSLDRAEQATPRPANRAPGSQGRLLTASGSADLADYAGRLGDKTSEAVLVAVDQGQALVHIRTDARALRRKIENYRDRDTSSGRPRNEPLVARIDGLRVPTLADLSLREFGSDDIDPADTYWVELWARGGRLENEATRERVQQEVRWLAVLGARLATPTRFEGVERDIYLVRLTGEVLAELPGLIPEVYEVHLAPRVRMVEALLLGERTAAPPVPVEPLPETAAVVAVHDTGTSPGHPYLDPALLGVGSAVPGEPDPTDKNGHGTEMSGIAVYSDYLQGIAGGRLRPQNGLVGMRLIPTPGQGPDDDPGLWADRTENAIAQAEELAGDHMVVHSMSVGAANPTGIRTAWSIGVDLQAWNGGAGRLIVVAAGNVPNERIATDADTYPVVNLGEPLCQPAQAWNALTVGGFTALTGAPAADTGVHPPALAPAGGLSPYAATDVGGPSRPIKPDVVKEAGNTAPGGGLPGAGTHHLSLWTTSRRHATGELSTQTWATSPAAAAAAGDLAILARRQPHLGPVGLRALYTHTARWTPAMESQFADRKDRLRAVGYGLPDLGLASGAASNRPVFIHEGSIAPGRRRLQMLQVPLPERVLNEHAEERVRLAVTLSYFVEPTENLAGQRYAGGRLRWELQGPTESEAQLRRRVNALAGGGSAPKSTGYRWTVGSQLRSRGTLQHDYVELTASELVGDRLLAICPTLGWWEDRDSTRDIAVPYAIVVSVDFGSMDIDLYAAIQAAARSTIST